MPVLIWGALAGVASLGSYLFGFFGSSQIKSLLWGALILAALLVAFFIHKAV